MVKYYLVSILLLVSSILSAQAYKTEAFSSEIATIEVNGMGEWNRNAVIKLNSNEYISIRFDHLTDDTFSRLRYNILHCGADWLPSREISEIEYLDGFNNNLIDDYGVSVNTTVDYTNYKLEIPNRDVSFKLSGNYVVQVYDEDNLGEILFNACFSVIEPMASIGYKVSSVTNIDANKGHQQVSLTVNHTLSLRDPISELKVFVRQNNRLDNERKHLKPMMITPKRISYEQNLDLIFEAGNEYRRFETSSYRSNGMRVAHIQYSPPYYYSYIEQEKIRANKSYSYDQDQDGRFMIRSADTNNSDNEADYFMTTFTLPMDSPLLQDIYISGYFTNNTFSDKYKMKYDSEKKQYTLSLLLKQGLYNYQYLYNTGKGFSTAIIEGNYFETENEYSAFVYYRPTGQRYDRLIATSTFLSRQK